CAHGSKTDSSCVPFRQQPDYRANLLRQHTNNDPEKPPQLGTKPFYNGQLRSGASLAWKRSRVRIPSGPPKPFKHLRALARQTPRPWSPNPIFYAWASNRHGVESDPAHEKSVLRQSKSVESCGRVEDSQTASAMQHLERRDFANERVGKAREIEQ